MSFRLCLFYLYIMQQLQPFLKQCIQNAFGWQWCHNHTHMDDVGQNCERKLHTIIASITEKILLPCRRLTTTLVISWYWSISGGGAEYWKEQKAPLTYYMLSGYISYSISKAAQWIFEHLANLLFYSSSTDLIYCFIANIF